MLRLPIIKFLYRSEIQTHFYALPIGLILTVCLFTVNAQYPYTVNMNQTMIGNAAIAARLEVVHLPGFEAKAGLEYDAYIGKPPVWCMSSKLSKPI